MDIRFYSYDSNTYSLTILGTVDNFSSFNFTRSFAGIGDWQMKISGNTKNAARIKNADFIAGVDGVAGLITNFQEEVGESGITYTFSGVELKGLASKRIIMPPTGEAYLHYSNKSPEFVMADIINTQLVSSAANRKYGGSIASYSESSTSISYDGRYDNVAEELVNLAETYAIGWYADITPDGEIKWHIVHGFDRTEEQSLNNRLILSYDRDTLESSNLEISKAIPNVAIVAGQGTGVDRSIATVGSAAGLDRYELYIDARDLEDSTQLPQRGNEKLAEYGDNTVFEITLSPLMVNQYRNSFDLGDIGTIKTTAFVANCVLSEVTEVYEGGNLVTIDTTFGFDKQTINSALKRINSNANTLVKVEETSGGGGGGGSLPTLATVATTGDYNDLINKPSAYTLPTASTSTLGGVKVDGSTITINNGVISASSSGGGSSDVEYGTWTPTISMGAYSTSYRKGWYTKIGNIVTITFSLKFKSDYNDDDFIITNLPFAEDSSYEYGGGGNCQGLMASEEEENYVFSGFVLSNGEIYATASRSDSWGEYEGCWLIPSTESRITCYVEGSITYVTNE